MGGEAEAGRIPPSHAAYRYRKSCYADCERCAQPRQNSSSPDWAYWPVGFAKGLERSTKSLTVRIEEVGIVQIIDPPTRQQLQKFRQPLPADIAHDIVGRARLVLGLVDPGVYVLTPPWVTSHR